MGEGAEDGSGDGGGGGRLEHLVDGGAVEQGPEVGAPVLGGVEDEGVAGVDAEQDAGGGDLDDGVEDAGVGAGPFLAGGREDGGGDCVARDGEVKRGEVIGGHGGGGSAFGGEEDEVVCDADHVDGGLAGAGDPRGVGEDPGEDDLGGRLIAGDDVAGGGAEGHQVEDQVGGRVEVGATGPGGVLGEKDLG